MQNKIEINNTQHKTSLYNYILLIFKVLCSYCITLYILVGFKKQYDPAWSQSYPLL